MKMTVPKSKLILNGIELTLKELKKHRKLLSDGEKQTFTQSVVCYCTNSIPKITEKDVIQFLTKINLADKEALYEDFVII